MSNYNKIEDQFVSYDIALELHKLNYDIGETLIKFYVKPKSLIFRVDEKGRYYPISNVPKKLHTVGEVFAKTSKNVISAPLYQQVFDYFETEHKLFSVIRIGFGYPIWYDYMIEAMDNRTIQIDKDVWLDTDEEGNDIYGDWESDTYVQKNQSFETKKEAQIACINKLIELVKEEKNEINKLV